MTEEPTELIAQAKQVTANITDFIMAASGMGAPNVPTLPVVPAITSTPEAKRVLAKMAKQAMPIAKMSAMGVGPKIAARGQGIER